MEADFRQHDSEQSRALQLKVDKKEPDITKELDDSFDRRISQEIAKAYATGYHSGIVQTMGNLVMFGLIFCLVMYVMGKSYE